MSGSDAPAQPPASSLASKIGLGSVAVVVLIVALSGGVIAAAIVALALLGTPLFAIMGGASELAWLFHRDATFHHLRYIAPTVLDERFSDSPILVTIPLFTFVGYVMAESKASTNAQPGEALRAEDLFSLERRGDRIHALLGPKLTSRSSVQASGSTIQYSGTPSSAYQLSFFTRS